MSRRTSKKNSENNRPTTIYAGMQMIKEITKARENDNYSTGIFIDLQKAVDAYWGNWTKIGYEVQFSLFLAGTLPRS